MHRLLQRQVKRHLGVAPESVTALPALLDAIATAYEQFDSDHVQIERSLELMSTELLERNLQLSGQNEALEQAKAALQASKDELETRVADRTAELRRLNDQLLVDIAERKAAEERLRESEARYALAVHGANDGIWDWDLRSGVVYYSPRWKSMLGHSEAEVGTTPDDWFQRVHAEDAKTLEAAISSHLDGMTPHFEIEHRMLHRDGSYRWILSRGAALIDEAGKPYRLAGSQSDITERKNVEAQLLQAAFNDTLTGLPNRALFTERLDRAIIRTRRAEDFGFAVLFLDLDRFKVINDSLGHHAGDELLIMFAQRLNSCLRPGDTLGRLGGDEFTILLEDINGCDVAVSVANRIHEALKPPFIVQGHEIFTSASVGIAMSNATYERAPDMLRDADTAMYRAKASGKARHEVFDIGMHARAVKVLQLENDLRRAIERGEFVVHYQPIIMLQGTSICGLEALVRWQHPERGLVPPLEFIPVAEETGLIMEIGDFVLREACRQGCLWHAMPGAQDRPYVAVNLSGKQFAQSDLVEQITNVLSETGFDPHYLVLEITESIVMENPEAGAAMLRRLKEMGVKVNIDDFGTGYSSLGYLQRFPADTMKIDRSFVAAMLKGGENAEIVRTIVSLAHSLDMTVTAEGIETVEQLQALKNLGCEYAQGYYFSKPVDAASATRLLTSGKVWGAMPLKCA